MDNMKKLDLVLIIPLFILLFFSSCEKSYKEIKISNQVWMAENLNVNKFSNGDHIGYAKNKEELLSANNKEEPAWCFYNHDPNNEKNMVNYTIGMQLMTHETCVHKVGIFHLMKNGLF